jgi:transaldolase
MALFLDSAHIEDVKQALALGFVSGVTTNPALVARTGREGMDILRDILALTPGPVFYQVTSATAEGREAQARAASALAPERVYIKIPATTGNFTLAARLAAGGILCAITAVSHPSQAYLSVQVGAAYTIPYVNRLTRQLGDGIAVLRSVAAVARGTNTRVLAASLKSVDEVMAAAMNGAEDITIPLDLILQLGDHPLSQKAIDDFDAAMQTARSG